MLKYYILTFGCQMNKSDAERLASVLENLGFKLASDEADADLVFVNACSVRQSAMDRVFGKNKHFINRRKKKEIKTFLFGCVLPKDVSKMKKIFDHIFDIKELPNIVNILKQNKVEIPKTEIKLDDTDYFHVSPIHSSTFQAFVPIMRGCDHFCSYCAVPYAKGPEISRPAMDIYKEVKDLIDKGYKEITLLGQNVNSYGLVRPRWKLVDEETKKMYPPESWVLDKNSALPPFVQLLEKIDSLDGDFWIRFISSHPMDMSLDLISTISKSQHITPFIHLPVQAGNDEILKKMNRRYTIKWYKEIINNIRRQLPDALISTDTIVGFPGETEQQFNDTLDIYDYSQFEIAYIAKYSPRPGAASTHFEDNVTHAEKKRREKELTKKLSDIALATNEKQVGKEVKVLVESIEDGFAFGHTKEFRAIKFPYSGKIGEFVNVKITKANPWGMIGEIIKNL